MSSAKRSRPIESLPGPASSHGPSSEHSDGESTVQAIAAPLPLEFYTRPVVEVARGLLGKLVVRTWANEIVVARIVETEAYSAGIDQASHSYRGRTPRNASMFGQAGRAYVYRSYGIHNMFNVVTTQEEGPASAVLVRGMEIETWSDILQRARPSAAPREMLRGPGNLCAALEITKDLDGHSLTQPPLMIAAGAEPTTPVIETTRVGITKSTELPWRFYVFGSSAVSRRDRAAESIQVSGASHRTLTRQSLRARETA